MVTLKRVLFVLDCGLQLPSSMVRALQFQPLFQQSKTWEAEFVSRQSESLVRLTNRFNRPSLPLISPLFHRPLALYSKRWHERHEDEIVERAADFDVVYTIKVPSARLHRRLCGIGRPRILMDLNDALWLPAFSNGEWSNLNEMLAKSNGIICENDYLASYAKRYSSRVFVVPDAPQLEKFESVRETIRRDTNRLVLGWLGGAENIGALYRLYEPLEALFLRNQNLHLRIVGAGEAVIPRFEYVRFSCKPAYNQEEMIREVLRFDVGLFPLHHNVDGLARGTLKAKIYMSGGAVAACENYGENSKLIEDGVNGVLAESTDEWREKLETLITDGEGRSAIANCGLQTIRRHFSAEQIFTTLITAFDTALQSEQTS